MKNFTDFKAKIHQDKQVFDLFFEEIANTSGGLATTTTTDSAGEFNDLKGIDKPLRKKKFRRKELDKYEGKVFKVSNEMFERMKEGKIRKARWNRYIDEDSELGVDIKKYSLRNPSQPVVIQNEETGEIVFLRRRQNDGRLRHNK